MDECTGEVVGESTAGDEGECTGEVEGESTGGDEGECTGDGEPAGKTFEMNQRISSFKLNIMFNKWVIFLISVDNF